MEHDGHTLRDMLPEEKLLPNCIGKINKEKKEKKEDGDAEVLEERRRTFERKDAQLAYKEKKEDKEDGDAEGLEERRRTFERKDAQMGICKHEDIDHELLNGRRSTPHKLISRLMHSKAASNFLYFFGLPWKIRPHISCSYWFDHFFPQENFQLMISIGFNCVLVEILLYTYIGSISAWMAGIFFGTITLLGLLFYCRHDLDEGNKLLIFFGIPPEIRGRKLSWEVLYNFLLLVAILIGTVATYFANWVIHPNVEFECEVVKANSTMTCTIQDLHDVGYCCNARTVTKDPAFILGILGGQIVFLHSMIREIILCSLANRDINQDDKKNIRRLSSKVKSKLLDLPI